MKKILIFLLLGIVLFSGCANTITKPNPLSNNGNSVLTSNYGILHKPLYQFLSLTGTPGGATNVNGNYAINSTRFYIQPNSTQEFVINRLIIHIEDVGSFDTGRYGNNIVLTNGITIQYIVNNTIMNLTDDHPILNNGDWGKHNYDMDKQSWGIGNPFLNSRWTFSKAGEPLILKGSNNDSLSVILNDDFTGLVEHTFLAQGFDKSNIIYG